MMLCGKFLEILTGNDIAYSVSLIHANPLRQLRRFLPVANFSFVSFGRFYAIYTITAPNTTDLHTLECTGFSKAVQKGVL